MTLQDRLQALGLGENEAKVYLAALKLGETTVGDLTRESGLHKQLVYNGAEKLQAEGLMTISQIRGRRRFQAADPSILENRVEERLGAVRGLLPALYEVANSKKSKDLVRTYSGLTAVQQYYQQSMRSHPPGKDLLVTGIGGQHFFELWDLHSLKFQRYEELRNIRNIPLKLLFFLTPEQGPADIKGLTERKNLTVRAVRETPQAPLDIIVWHTHIGIMTYGQEPHAIDIAGEQIVKAFRAYFQAMWQQAEPVPVKM